MGRGGTGPRSAPAGFGPWHYRVHFAFSLVTYFIGVFFNSGLVPCVEKRLAGEQPTVRDGLAAAFASAGRIFQGALLSATVGVLLRVVEERLGRLARPVAPRGGPARRRAPSLAGPGRVPDRGG